MAEGGPPELETQKSIIGDYLKETLKKDEFWYLVDVRWFKQWKKYVGYDQWDTHSMGDQSVHPGPIDNSSLFMQDTKTLKEDLVDELDYILLPKEGFEKLASWYGTIPTQEPITRKVIEQGVYVKHCKVEVYLMELKLCENSDTTNVFAHLFSRADTIAMIEKVMRERFSIADSKEVRLWNRYMSNTYEHLSKMDVTLQNAGLYPGQVIVVEIKNEDGSWPRQQKSTSAYSSNYPSTSNHQSSSVGGGMKYSSGAINSFYSRNGYDRGGNSKPGVCGLANLGNTCFMNSALQCMSNVPQLTDYMLGSQWEKELNKKNPLGMRGEIAISYNELIRDIWAGLRSHTVPRNFKIAVGRFAPQFSGYQQQDSQELMAFLLDGLHEDLNRIRKKPYIELKDSGGRPDKVVAEEAWENYKKRNDSIIVDTFHALLKSTVRCPDCVKISVTFDPFCYLSLPLPFKKERHIDVIWVPLHPEKKPMQLKLTVPKSGNIRDLCTALSNQVHSPSDRMVVTDVYNHKFHKIFNFDEGVNPILDRDDIFIYEIPSSNIEDPTTMILPIYLREKRYSVRHADKNSVSSQPLFGHPLLLAVPRQGCTYEKLYQLLLQRMARYVRTPSEGEDWQGEPTDDSEDDTDSSVDTNSSAAGASNGNWDEDGEGGEASNGHSTDGTDQMMETTVADGENNSNKYCNGGSTSHTSSKKQHIFTLRAVNSFGRDELGTVLVDDGKPLRINDRTHIAVDWSKEAKDRFYDDKAAESFEEHPSMKFRGGQKKPVIQLDDCLKLFMKEEQLSEQDPWYCPDCKQHKQATKKFDLWSLPDILIIHLKRFHYNHHHRDKIDALVEFPTQGLDLRKYIINEECTVKNEYDLIAVTNHYGGLGGGHYTAYAKNKDDNSWYYFDDSSVSSSSSENTVTNAAYVLVYQRKQQVKPAAPWPSTESLRPGMIPIPVVHIQNNDISTHSGGPSSPHDQHTAIKQENGVKDETDDMDTSNQTAQQLDFKKEKRWILT
ncbi:hypothetical protein RRG08_031063 [Elysia crispata]|uniref:ubiquitinyl hydrolase 1 n=1 Tax=Elysia crispata TaxID=231223 RepID=A0AAE1DFT0_9GAST|nr:hypothetical protein RRG08_031063 [Elysia crispata]